MGQTFTSEDSVFNNQGGTISVTSGAFDIAQLHLSTGAGMSTGGTFDASTGAVLDISTIGTLTGTYTGTGGGVVQLSNGTIAVGMAGATFNFAPGLFQWTGGTIAGPGTLTNTMGMTLSGSNGWSLNTTLDNQGTVTQTGAGTLSLSNASPVALFTNAANATVDLGSKGEWLGGTIDNLGTIDVAAGMGQTFSELDSTFNNQGGTISVTSGTFAINQLHGSTGPGNSTGGTFDASAGAVLDISSIGTLTGTYTGTGGGVVQLSNGGTIVIGASGATFHFSTGLFHWTGGNFSGPGTLTSRGRHAGAGSAQRDREHPGDPQQRHTDQYRHDDLELHQQHNDRQPIGSRFDQPVEQPGQHRLAGWRRRSVDQRGNSHDRWSERCGERQREQLGDVRPDEARGNSLSMESRSRT